jgi:2-polyprenylphenol 6-hydroxylase
MRRASGEVIVVGAGPVGIACALALRKHAAKVSVLDRRPLATDALDANFDHRVYALSPASRALLQSLGVWSRIDIARLTPIDRMQVWSDADAGAGSDATPTAASSLPRIDFEEGQPLAWMVEHKALMAALAGTLHASDIGFEVVPSMHALSDADAAGKRVLQFEDGVERSCDLLVGADGRQSQIRTLAGIDVETKDYLSSAVVANFACAKPHGGTAFQWFSAEGVLAYLPLPGNRISIVWSVSTARAAELQVQARESMSEFAASVARAGHERLGALECISPVDIVPLNRVLAREVVKPGLVLVGDAAHGIHPLAGQGANLGYGDVSALEHEIANRGALAGIGDIALLRRVARARAEPTVAMAETTDRLQGLFSRGDNVSKWVRRTGFAAFGRSALMKHLAMGHAMKN